MCVLHELVDDVTRTPRLLETPLDHGLEHSVWCGDHPAPPGHPGPRQGARPSHDLIILYLILQPPDAPRPAEPDVPHHLLQQLDLPLLLSQGVSVTYKCVMY